MLVANLRGVPHGRGSCGGAVRSTAVSRYPSSPGAFLAQQHNVWVSGLPVAGQTTKGVRMLPSSKGALDNGLPGPINHPSATRPRAGSDMGNLDELGDPLRAGRPHRAQGKASQCT